MKRVAILGGGITGLATAYYLQQLAGDAVEVTLIEASGRLGGKVVSTPAEGFLIEGGPDSFISTKKAALDLCRELGLDDQLIGSNSAKNPTYIWSRNRLHPMPEGMMLMAPTMILPMARSRLFSWAGKLRMGLEPFILQSKSDEDESLADFVRRRLGKEALAKIASPLMAGIHSGDAEKLSIRSTFPMFPEIEQKHGSLIRGMLHRKEQQKQAATNSNGKRMPMFYSLRGGVEQLTEAIQSRLCIKQLLNSRARSVTRDGDAYAITLENGERISADEIVFATPAYVTADLVEQTAPELASRLRGIRYVSVANVSLGFRREDIPPTIKGYGFVVPPTEGRKITACSISSLKFNNRAVDEDILFRVFIGGAHAEPLATLDEAELIEIAREELRTMLKITAAPLVARAYRWNKSTPQYEVGHRVRVAAIEQSVAAFAGWHLAGAAYRGVGIPECIESGLRAAQAIVSRLNLI